FYSFYFRLYQGTVKSAEVVDFLQALLRHLSGSLLIVWDRLSAHRSRITRDFMAGQGQRYGSDTCPAMHRNSTQSGTSGATGSRTRYPMSARKTTGAWSRQRASKGYVAILD